MVDIDQINQPQRARSHRTMVRMRNAAEDLLEKSHNSMLCEAFPQMNTIVLGLNTFIAHIRDDLDALDAYTKGTKAPRHQQSYSCKHNTTESVHHEHARQHLFFDHSDHSSG